jgi:hypothetical protein
MSFEESWRKTVGSISAQRLKIIEELSTTQGLGTKIYSGQVTATGADYETAYDTAAGRARELGDNKEQVKLEERLEGADVLRMSQSLTPPENAPLGTLPGVAANAADAVDGIGNVVWVTVEFSFTYRSKGTRLWIEMGTSVATSTSGEDREEVQGSIVAADVAAMTSAYLDLKSAYAGRLIREEETIDRADQIGEIDLVTGDAKTTKTVTALRRDFRFSVFRAKAAAQIALRYEMNVTRNWRENTKTTSVRGTIWAADAAVDDTGIAGGYLTAFLTELGLSNPTSSSRTKSAERAPSFNRTTRFGDPVEAVSALQFEETYESVLSGASAILQSSLREELQLSGNRVVVAATAETTPVIQKCGTTEGRRTLRGVVVATNEATATDWVKKQKQLPLPGTVTAKIAGVAVTAGEPDPVNLVMESVFVDMQNGVARAGNYAGYTGTLPVSFVKMVRAEFTYSEVFEEFTMPL